ncbi:MAG: hypothetical protein Q8O38_00215 [Sulfurimicrobium sp.]|nr:hypothetical protein [Sulfurimicrobium sp.]
MRQSMTIRLDQEVLAVAKRVAEANNRTLTNYIETLIRKDIAGNRGNPDVNPVPQQNELFEAYSAGRMTRRALEDETGLWFGEVLAEMGKRGLPLPRVDSTVHLNSKQLALHDAIFGVRPQ